MNQPGYVDAVLRFANGKEVHTEGKPVVIQGFEFMKDMVVVRTRNADSSFCEPRSFRVVHAKTGMTIPSAAQETEDAAHLAATIYMNNKGTKAATWITAITKAEIQWEQIKEKAARQIQYQDSDISPE